MYTMVLTHATIATETIDFYCFGTLTDKGKGYASVSELDDGPDWTDRYTCTAVDNTELDILQRKFF